MHYFLPIPHDQQTVRFASPVAHNRAMRSFHWLALLLACPLLVGCSSAGSNYPHTGILLAEEPDGAKTVLEVREALLGPSAVEHLRAGLKHVDPDAQSETEQGDTHTQPKESTKSDGPAGPMEVVIVGQIGGLANPWKQTETDFPFVGGQAKFFLADPDAVAEHLASGHHHAPGEECTFCAAHAKDNSALLAVVQFKDQQGQVLHRDARRWFTLKGNETVVVHGQARIVAGGLLVVDADSLYVRR